MDKASKTAIVARHEPTGLYFSKQAGLTDNLFNALSFSNPDDAIRYWTQSLYRPHDIENYKLYHIVTTKEVVIDVQNELNYI